MTWILSEHKTALVTSFDRKEVYLPALESAIECGRAIIFEDVDIVFDSIVLSLQREILLVASTDKPVIKFNGKPLTLHSDFRLYLTTRLSNPRLNPLIYGSVTVVNFSITERACEARLLSVVFRVDRPDLEAQHRRTAEDIKDFENAQSRANDKLLQILSGVEGNLLDNGEVVQQLEVTKQEVQSIGLQLAEFRDQYTEVEAIKREFLPLAKIATCLFFVLYNFKAIHPLYEFSLAAFEQILQQTIQNHYFNNGQRGCEFDTELVQSQLIRDVFSRGALSLFGEHLIVFVLELATKLEILRGHVSQADVDFFIRGATGVDIVPVSKLVEQTLTPQGWSDVLKLARHSSARFSQLPELLIKHADTWSKWLKGKTPERAEIPFHPDLTPFEKLMVLRCFRVDRLFHAVVHYISITMGEGFVAKPVIDIDNLVNNYCSNAIPLIFVLRQGFDPVNAIRKLLDDRRGGGDNKRRLIELSVGTSDRGELFRLMFVPSKR